MDQIKIDSFEEDNSFYKPFTLYLTIKSFDVQAIRTRYLASKSNSKTGSVERRPVSIGGIASVKIDDGKIADEHILAKMAEPRGIAFKNGVLAIASENTVYLIDDTETRELTNPWFSYIHTIDFHPTENKILVASSGYDCVFEYDLSNLEKTFEWYAWENGLNISKHPKTGDASFLTRNTNDATEYAANNQPYLLIENPETTSLPTALRSAFINSVSYDKSNPNFFLATLFHKGAVIRVDRTTGQHEVVVSDLKTPHGGINYKSNYAATSTGSGEVVLSTDQGQKRYFFGDLAGKPEILGSSEWLQNSISDKEGNFITIDSNRNQFTIFNPTLQKRSHIKFDENWAVQDGFICEPSPVITQQLTALNQS
jgi:hypothetical protein